MIRGFQAAPQGQYISHLQYVDDTIFFVAKEENQLYAIRMMLEVLQEVNSLKVYLNKSQVIGVNMKHRAIRISVVIVGCQVG